MKNFIIMMGLVFTASAGWADVNCQIRLHSEGGMSPVQAPIYCQLNSSDEFINCQVHLYSNGMLPDYAGDRCLKNSTSEFIACQNNLYSNGGMRPNAAADYCLQNSSVAFVNCQNSLYSRGGMLPSIAADQCLANKGLIRIPSVYYSLSFRRRRALVTVDFWCKAFRFDY